jgi:hypothetical protein
MHLTEEEIKLVEEHRRKKADREALKAKRENCKHDWYVYCSSAIADWLKCSHCGESKFSDD